MSLPIICAACFYVYSVISALRTDQILVLSEPEKFSTVAIDAIEMESSIKKLDFVTYLSWVTENNKAKITEDLDLKIKGVQNQYLFINKDLKLPKLIKNDCQENYCLQSRISFPNIPAVLWRGLIGIEDYRFLSHKGVDPRSLLRALWHDLKVGRLEQGGSTLTQQLVKNLFYTNEKKFSRKINEMIASTYIESKFSKEEILQTYFNEVLWGSIQGIKIRGVRAAAAVYFKKTPEELTSYEASILVSMLKGPYYYNPIWKMERLKIRVRVVFHKLMQLGLFSKNAYEWTDEDWKKWNSNLVEESKGVNWKSLVLLSRRSSEKQSYSNYVFINESLKIVNELKKKHPKKDIALKATLIDLNAKPDGNKFNFYSKPERSLENALSKENHQIGSTIKPIIYGILVENGFELEDEIETGPIKLKLLSGEWSPKESDKNIPDRLSLKDALVKSLNAPVVRLVRDFGFENFEKQLSKVIPRLKKPLSEYPSQLLGASELSLNEFSDIYVNFLKRACFEKIGISVLDALSDPTTTTIRGRVGKLMGKMRFFGKTGTSNFGFDNWFVGFDGRELMIIWVGIESGRNKERDLKIYGSNSAFLVYRDYYLNRGKRFNEMMCH